MEEKTKEKHKKTPKWLKWLLGALMLFVFLFIILFPPVFSRLILKPAIEEGFQQATSNQYQVQFKDLKWSLLSRNLEMRDIKISPVSHINDSSKYVLLKLKKLKFDKIRYRKLLDGKLVLKKLDLEGLIIRNQQFQLDSITTSTNGNIGLLESVIIEEINLNIDSILFIEQLDSSFILSKGVIQIDGIVWDSLNIKNHFNWPIVSKMSLSFNSMLYQNDEQKIHFENFKISEKRLKHFNALFEKIQIDDLIRNNSYSFHWPGISIDSVRRIQKDSIWKFKAQKFSFSNDSLRIVQHFKAQFNPNTVVENFKEILEKIGLEVAVNQVEFKNKYLKLDTPEYESEFGNAGIHIQSMLLSKDDFRIQSYGFSLGKTHLKLKEKSDHISFNALMVGNQKVEIDQLKYLPSDKSFDFFTNHLKVSHVNWNKILDEKAIFLDEIHLIEPNIKGYFNNKKVSFKTFPFDFHIDRFLVSNGNIDWIPLKLRVNSFDLEVDSLVGEKEEVFKPDSTFRNLKLVSDQMSFGQADSGVFVQLSQNKWNTKDGAIQSDWVKLNHTNEFDTVSLLFGNFSISGLKWKNYIVDKNEINLEKFTSDQLQIKVSLFTEKRAQDSLLRLPQIQIEYIDIPEVAVNLNLKDQKSLYFEKLSIQSDSLIYSNSLNSTIKFAHLAVQSNKTIYAENGDSLLLKLNHWNYESEGHNWQLDQLELKQTIKENKTKSLSVSGLKIPSAKLCGMNPVQYLGEKKIELDSLWVHQARFKFDGERFKEIGLKNSLNWQQEIRELVEKYVYIDLKYIKVDDASLSFKTNYMGRRDEISLKNLDINVQELYIDYQNINDFKPLFFSDKFRCSFNSYFHSVNNGRYLFDINRAFLNSDSRKIEFSKISFLSLSDQSKLPLNFQLDSLVFDEFKLTATSFLPELELGSLAIIRPMIQMKNLEKTPKDSMNLKIDSINLYPIFRKYLNAIDIKNMTLVNGDLDLISKQEKYYVHGIDFKLDNIRIDSFNQNFTDKKFFYADDLSIEIPQFSWISNDRMYRYGFERLNFVSNGGIIELDSLYIKSRYDRKTFSANLKYQKDQIDAILPKIKLIGFDFRDAIFRQRFKAKSLNLYNPDLRIYKDKTIEPDVNVYKMMPAEQLQSLGFYINIDSARIYNGFVEYTEQASYMERPGKIYFNNMDMRFTGINNDQNFREFGGSLRILGNAKLMGKSKVNITADFSLKSDKQNFKVLASMDQLDAVSLNPLIQPLTLLSARQGNLRSMQMNVQGNNDYAFGEMLLKYEDLKVEVMNKKLKESSVATFLANSFMIRKNNKNYFFPRKGPIYFERLKYRSFIHYLSHFAIVGAKTSLGVDKRKTQKKVNEVVEKENK